MDLDHAVITMVARDDLVDGGMAHMAACVEAIRERRPSTAVETLISDAKGDDASLELLFAARPDVLNHNVETVRPAAAGRAPVGRVRTQPVRARPGQGGRARREVGLDRRDGRDRRRGGRSAWPISPASASTSSPSASTCGRRSHHLPVGAVGGAGEFDAWKGAGEALGIGHVEASPLTRSSYHAKSAASHVTPVAVSLSAGRSTSGARVARCDRCAGYRAGRSRRRSCRSPRVGCQ